MTRQEIRTITGAYRASTSLASWLKVLLDAVLYAACAGAVLSTERLIIQLPLSLAMGVMIARLFILGHDACHGSLFASRRANRIVGRLLFLPSLTPFSLWEAGHNVAHHGYTNLRGRDHVWCPLSKAEFDGLPLYRRCLERLYRAHMLGPGVYYLVELWWKKLFFPSRAHVGVRRKEHVLDGLLVSAFACIWLAGTVSWGARVGASATSVVVLLWLVPFAIWNLLVGFVTYVQHTHPGIAWYQSKQEWQWCQAQVLSTPHVVFPLRFSGLLHNIMEHTAHHLDTSIPLCNLPDAQAHLEGTLEPHVHAYRWSIGLFRDIQRICRLYDYETHHWLDFDGRVAEPPVSFDAHQAPVLRTHSATVESR